MKEGFVKISRQLLEWEWFQESNMVHMLIYLVMKANYSPSKYQGHIIGRGQLVFGRKSASADTNISEQSIRTCMERLQKSGVITIKSTNSFSIVTISKYDTYQGGLKGSNQPFNQQLTIETTSDQPATNQQLTTSEEYQEYQEEKERVVEHALITYTKGLKQVCKLRDQLTNNDAVKLIGKWPKEMIKEVLDAMDNTKGIENKYISVYKTVNNWCKMRTNKLGAPTENSAPQQTLI